MEQKFCWVSALCVPVFVMELESQQICAWNNKLSEITKISLEEIVGKPISSCIDDEASLAVLSSCLKDMCTSPHMPFTCEFVIRGGGTDASVCCLRVKFSTCQGDRGSAPPLVVGFAERIDTQKYTGSSPPLAAPESAQDPFRRLDFPLCCVDLDGIITSWSSQLELALGYDSVDLIGRSFAELLLERSRERFGDLLQQVRSEQTLQETKCDFRLRIVGEHTKNAHFTISVHRNSENFVEGLGLILVDLEDRQPLPLSTTSEEEDNKFEENSDIPFVTEVDSGWPLLIESANTIVFGTNREGRVTEWNELCSEVTGYSKEAALQQPFLDLVIEPTFHLTLQEILDCCLNGRGMSNFEAAILTKSQDIRYWLLSATPWRDRSNNIVGMVVMAQDLTETIKYDRAVAAIASELRQFIETANAPIFGIDIYGSVQPCTHVVNVDKRHLILTFFYPSIAGASTNGMIKPLKLQATAKKRLSDRG